MDKIIKLVNKISLPIIAVVILTIFLVFSRECRRDVFETPTGMTLVSDSFIDSLEKVATVAPDTLFETVYLKGETIYVPGEVPEPIIIDAETKAYSDSIVNDSISVWVDIVAKGVITEWNWRYRPVILKKTITIEKPKPYPVPYEVPISKTGLYGSFGMGGNESTFILSGGLDFVTKKDRLYGLQYLRFGNDDFYMLKIGTKIKFKR